MMTPYLQKNHSPKNVFVLQPAPTVFELKGSYWYEKKQNIVLYSSIESFLFNFRILKKNTTSESWKFSAYPFFPFFVNNSFTMKKTGKVHNCYPSYFSILHVSINFHYAWAFHKGRKSWECGSHKADCMHTLDFFVNCKVLPPVNTVPFGFVCVWHKWSRLWLSHK